MRLGYYDRAQGGARITIYALPRNKGESRADYARRFFSEIRGLGNVALVLLDNRKHRVIARRGY